MPRCDGANQDGQRCTASIPWRVTQGHLLLPKSVVLFDLEQIGSTLSAVINQSHGGARLGPVGSPKPALACLCTSCWHARTDRKACVFHADDPRFLLDGLPDAERILSSVIRELMRFWSSHGQGLERFNGILNVDWDHVATDMLSFLTYRRYYRGVPEIRRYITPYHLYATSLERARDDSLSMPNHRWKSWLAGGPVWTKLPHEVRDLIQVQWQPHLRPTEAEMKIAVAGKIQDVLFDGLVNWYFKGPERRVDSIGGTCRQFLSPDGLGQLLTMGFVFPPYTGRGDRAVGI